MSNQWQLLVQFQSKNIILLMGYRFGAEWIVAKILVFKWLSIFVKCRIMIDHLLSLQPGGDQRTVCYLSNTFLKYQNIIWSLFRTRYLGPLNKSIIFIATFSICAQSPWLEPIYCALPYNPVNFYNPYCRFYYCQSTIMYYCYFYFPHLPLQFEILFSSPLGPITLKSLLLEKNPFENLIN